MGLVGSRQGMQWRGSTTMPGKTEGSGLGAADERAYNHIRAREKGWVPSPPLIGSRVAKMEYRLY